jgi:hypothetical protein
MAAGAAAGFNPAASNAERRAVDHGPVALDKFRKSRVIAPQGELLD